MVREVVKVKKFFPTLTTSLRIRNELIESEYMLITWQIWHLTDPLIEGIEHFNFSVAAHCRIATRSSRSCHDCPYNEVFH